MRVSRRVHDVTMAAARGVALAGAAWLFFAPDEPSALSAMALAVAVMAFGALAACCRKIFVDRSVVGTVCIWAALTVVFTDMLSLAPRGQGLLPDAVLDAPLRFYGVLCSEAIVLGLADLFLEAVQAHPGVSGVAALLGTVQGLVCAGLVLSLMLVGTSTSFGLLGQGFNDRLASPTRLLANALIWGACLLGCATVTLAVYSRKGRRAVDLARWGGLVVLLWGVVPSIVLHAWPSPLSAEAVRQGLLPASLPVYGLGFGVVFTLLWSLLQIHWRLSMPPVDRVDRRRGRMVTVLVVLAGLASVALQSQSVAWVPLADLRAGRAWLRPHVLSSSGEQQKVVFSPDGRTLWLGDRFGVRAGWRVDPGRSRWRPTVDFREGKAIRACSPEDAAWVDMAHPVEARLVEIVDRSDAHALLMVDARDGSTLARYRVDAGLEQAVSVRRDLVLGTGTHGPWVLRWLSGEWWGRDLDDWPTLSPDGRLMLLRGPREVACYDLSSGRRLISRPLHGTASACFDTTSSRVKVVMLSGERLVLDTATGGVVPPPDPWCDEARSPDGALVARAEPWGITLWQADSGRHLATMYARGARHCVVAPDGRVNGDLGSLEIVHDDVFIPVKADYPLYDVSLYPPVY